MTSSETFNHDLMAFLDASPTPFHAVHNMENALLAAGFQKLNEADEWKLNKQGKYFVLRNDSSICAFKLGTDALITGGIRLIGAHTDSPCLKVKPNPGYEKQGCYQLGVEVYGGALLNPWFDRDLSIAGRVSYLDEADVLQQALLDFKTAVATVPSLAIHLDRDANKKRSVNAQKHLPPIVMHATGEEGVPEFRELLCQQLLKQYPERKVLRVLDYDLSLYDTQNASLIGLDKKFLSSARLDNLLSCFVGLQSLLDDNSENTCMLICNDHEEVGSVSAAGAHGSFLKSVLERLSSDCESLTRMIDRSMLLSLDNAHAVHPNFSDKHDEHHGPLLNCGPVIKMNANQRYASNDVSSAVFRQLCLKQNVPVQTFVIRSDMSCGSTIGPIAAAQLGISTLDVGVPTLAMHSIRELAGSEDACFLFSAVCAFNEIKAL